MNGYIGIRVLRENTTEVYWHGSIMHLAGKFPPISITFHFINTILTLYLTMTLNLQFKTGQEWVDI